jgi:hypothetical protein
MKTDEPRHHQLKASLDEWIQHRVDELDFDEVGFWQIVSEGREGFGLTGACLDEFVKRSLLALFAQGALPVRHVPDSGYVWTWQKSYGESAEAMAEAIVAEWVRQGRRDPGLGDLWFGLKDALDRPHVQKS